jgi:hypothetical protein
MGWRAIGQQPVAQLPPPAKTDTTAGCI